MAFDLASFAKPISRAEAIRQGHLVDCTQAAAWVGFRTPAAMSAETWEECIGHHDVASTRAERADAGERLRQVWRNAAAALATYKSKGAVLPAIAFTARSVDGKRAVRLLLTAEFDGPNAVVTLTLGS